MTTLATKAPGPLFLLSDVKETKATHTCGRPRHLTAATSAKSRVSCPRSLPVARAALGVEVGAIDRSSEGEGIVIRLGSIPRIELHRGIGRVGQRERTIDHPRRHVRHVVGAVGLWRSSSSGTTPTPPQRLTGHPTPRGVAVPTSPEMCQAPGNVCLKLSEKSNRGPRLADREDLPGPHAAGARVSVARTPPSSLCSCCPAPHCANP